jgi:hypothetical protein
MLIIGQRTLPQYASNFLSSRNDSGSNQTQ